ncbi:MAG: hypothetical protein ACREDR_01915 [Blastocatellia bacterium]
MQYKEFWEHVKEIHQLFKTLKPLFREDRERLWTRFDEICKQTKDAQTREQNARKNNSQWKRRIVESKITAAYQAVHYAQDTDELRRARGLLSEAREIMKDSWDGLGHIGGFTPFAAQGPLILTREDREACWQHWKEVEDYLNQRWRAFSEERDRVLSNNYAHFKSQPNHAQNVAYNGDGLIESGFLRQRGGCQSLTDFMGPYIVKLALNLMI